MKTETIEVPGKELATRRAAFAPSSIDADARTVDVTWTTGEKVLRGYFEKFYEELSLDPKHVRMGRLTSGRAPVLSAHNGYDLNAAIGVVASAQLAGTNSIATLRIAKDDEHADKAWNKIAQGVLPNVSVGYRVYRYEKIEAGADQIPVVRAVDWEPYEISFVPMGADSGASVRSALHEDTAPMTKIANSTTLEPEREEITAAERNRAAAITEVVRTANLPAEFAEGLIRNGTPIDQARALIIGRLAENDNKTRTNGAVPVTFREDAADPRLGLMAEALAARFGGPNPSNDAREFMHMRTLDMARVCLEERGVRTRLMSQNQIMQRAITHSTSDFPALLAESGTRLLRQGYASYQGGIVRICRKSTAPDFRAKSKLNLSEAPALLKVGENGEVKHGTVAEAKESYSLATYARIFNLSRTALINDDLGAFADFTQRQGRAAAELVAGQLAALLASNPIMGNDGVALFDAAHGNLGTPGAISITTLGEALKLMRLQKGLDGVTPIDVTPKFLVAPAALEVVARQHVAQVNATKSSDVNPFTADLDVVIDPRLDSVSPTAWYLAADPTLVDTIEYSFLEEADGPQFETKAGFEQLGIATRVLLDFGCGVIDHRGLVKNAG